MSEFRTRRRWAIAEWSLTVLVVAIAVLNLIVGDVLGFVLAACWACAQSAISTIAVRRMRSARARLDLRQAYPPRRDRLHRDLERLSKLRDAPTAPPPRPRAQRVYWESDWRRRRTVAGPTYGEIIKAFNLVVLGFRRGFLIVAPFLFVALLVVVVCTLVSLL